ncbi:MAG: bifunctional adenosylcobinamide kinase/adenosylcobinamide-phosphate guanylyltransferase [Atribacterota bacterium]|jgi:adenosylcobinamide kinase/adenosylcobinamide-phosphate guanylyltransferase|nr:bifunctional adenosylcobinamide kinase/adenosylcobinamide-phosphate guanylyltransferase [Atribacterota bacterium]MDI9608124.1 bifunctional adenosylcobinamide kinase/adenosylcobinamide-phosphate guanylyltransferase [Atribacterota bacterium]
MQENWDKSVLFLGGARSGKSRLALEWVEESGLSPLYLATGVATDPEMEERILRHQRERSAMWKVEEVPFGLGEALEKDWRGQGVVLDCVTFLVNNIFWKEKDGEETYERLCRELSRIFEKRKKEHFLLLLVSNEVGMGVVPEYPAGREFRDLQGRVNQWIASQVDEAYLVVAGIPWRLK